MLAHRSRQRAGRDNPVEQLMDLSFLLEPARMQFCEQTLPGPIAHPADTWTNIGPLLAGVRITAVARRPLERLLGLAAIWTGLASAYFHASNTVLGETLDLSGMFLFILTLAALQQYRATPWIGTGATIAVVVLLSLVLTGLSAVSAVFATPSFALIVVLVIVRGILDRKLGPWAWAMVGTFAVAWAFWWADITGHLCIPGNHILTGHGVWHLLNGLVFWFAFLHFESSIGGTVQSRQPGAARQGT
jgi:hypothetical protein